MAFAIEAMRKYDFQLMGNCLKKAGFKLLVGQHLAIAGIKGEIAWIKIPNSINWITFDLIYFETLDLVSFRNANELAINTSKTSFKFEIQLS